MRWAKSMNIHMVELIMKVNQLFCIYSGVTVCHIISHKTRSLIQLHPDSSCSNVTSFPFASMTTTCTLQKLQNLKISSAPNLNSRSLWFSTRKSIWRAAASGLFSPKVGYMHRLCDWIIHSDIVLKFERLGFKVVFLICR